MSQLETNTTTIQSIIDKLAGKAAGGGGDGDIKMCTLTVEHTTVADGANGLVAIAYTTVKNGEVMGVAGEVMDLGTLELPCVKGSVVTFFPYEFANLICSGNAVEKMNWAFAYIIEVNGDATVTMS